MSSRRSALVLLLALVAAAPRAEAAAWEHPDFSTGKSRPTRIAILPAESEMVRARLNDAVPFVKETQALETALRAEAAASLKALGYEPDLDSLSPERIAADRDLQILVRELETDVGEIVDVASARPKDIGRGRFSVGEAVLPLQSRTGADGFLWLMSSSVVPSKGQRTLASIFSVLSGTVNVPLNQTQLLAVLVDARTGQLASVSASVVGGAVLKEPDKVAGHAAREVFEQWPAASAARQVSAKRLASAEASRAPKVAQAGETLDELTVVGRFEEAVARLEGGVAAGVPEDVVTRDEFTDGGAPIAADGAAVAEPVTLFEPGEAPPAPEPERARAPEPATRVAAAPVPTAAPTSSRAPASVPATTPATTPATVERAAPAAIPATPPPSPSAARVLDPEASAARSPSAAPPQPAAPPASPAPAGRSARTVWEAPADQRPAPGRQIVMQMMPGTPGIVVRNVAPPAVLVSVDLGEWRQLALGEEASFDVRPGSHGILVASLDGRELARANIIVGSRLATVEIWNP